MTSNVLGKNLTARELRGFTGYLRKKEHRIQELMTDVPTDAAHLKATCEKFATKSAFKVTLDLSVEGKKMHVYEDSHTVHEATDLAVDKLISQLKHRTQKRVGQDRRSRETRRALKESSIAPASDEEGPDQSALFQELQPMIPAITRKLEREIRKMELTSDIAHGQLTAEMIVDALVIDLYDRFSDQPNDLSFAQWAEQRARFLLHTMADEIRDESASTIHLDHALDETDPILDINELGDARMEYYQPDDVAFVEDQYDLESARSSA